MKLAVISLDKIIFEGEAKSVNCMTTAGEITVLDHHRPLITELSKGVLKIISGEDKETYIPIESGFLEVLGTNTARLLVDESDK